MGPEGLGITQKREEEQHGMEREITEPEDHVIKRKLVRYRGIMILNAERVNCIWSVKYIEFPIKEKFIRLAQKSKEEPQKLLSRGDVMKMCFGKMNLVGGWN